MKLTSQQEKTRQLLLQHGFEIMAGDAAYYWLHGAVFHPNSFAAFAVPKAVVAEIIKANEECERDE